MRNIIYNACALLIESSIASCSFVFSIACVDGLLTVSVLDHKKVQTCIWSDTASSVWRYAATRLNTQIINYLWVHSLQSNGTSFHIMHVRQGVRHIWKPIRFNVWETLFRILVTFAFDNAAQPLASLDVTKWRCFKNTSKQIPVHINYNDGINEQMSSADFLKKQKLKPS